jgi:small subunit ribosomal protein S15
LSIASDKKKEVMNKHSRSDGDTGSPEVQIALLTENISALQSHFDEHKKDHHSRQGLIRMVNKRRKLLDYLKKKDLNKYSSLIKELNLRK